MLKKSVSVIGFLVTSVMCTTLLTGCGVDRNCDPEKVVLALAEANLVAAENAYNVAKEATDKAIENLGEAGTRIAKEWIKCPNDSCRKQLDDMMKALEDAVAKAQDNEEKAKKAVEDARANVKSAKLALDACEAARGR